MVIMKRILSILLLAIAFVNVHAAQKDYEHVKINGLYYYVFTKGKSAGTAFVAPKEPEKCKGYSSKKDLEIPSSVIYKGKEYPIKGIGQWAFYGQKELNSVVIPNTVEIISTQAFSWCTNLLEVTIPNSVRIIEKMAFEYCMNLTKIAVPSAVTKIEYGTFNNCYALKDITMGDNITEIGAYAFGDCKSLEHFTIPSSVKEIQSKTFSDCTKLKISIPSGITKISEFAFYHCTSLQKVCIIPHSVKEIGRGAFWSCNLQEVEILSEDIKLGVYYDVNENEFYGPFGSNTVKKVVCGENVEFMIGRTHESFLNRYNIKQLGVEKNSPVYFSYTDRNAEKILTRHTGNGVVIFAISSETIKRQIDEWQKKKEFETVTQWKQRVTETTRNKKVREIVEDATQKMAKAKSTISILRTIGTYDMDYHILPINTCYGTSYFKVNNLLAEELKEHSRFINLYPTYTLSNDTIAIASLKMEYKGVTLDAEPTVESPKQDLALNLPPLEMNFDTPNKATPETNNIPQNNKIDNTIDINIPRSSGQNDKTFAVIIGNEQYSRVATVPFAQNDAKIFAAYCQKTLGIPEKNIRCYENATYGTLISAIDDIKNICDVYNGNVKVLFYYAGHGIPNEQTSDAYLLPVDADGRNTTVCLSLNTLYKELGNLKAQVCIAFIDACFSGAERGNNMLASARGVAIKSKQGTPEGNLITFSAASGDETAYPYIEKGHGLFTYFLLKKLQETNGNVTLGELGTYVTEMVRQHSITENKKLQTPVMKISTSITSDWKSIKLK